MSFLQWLPAIISGVSAINDTASNIYNIQSNERNFDYQQTIDSFNKDMAMKNYQLAVDQMNWQQQAQQTAWSREDNAIRRRVVDLEKAGLSKWLAAGQAAQAGGVTASNVTSGANLINSGANLKDVNLKNVVDSFLTGAERQAGISLTQKQEELIDARIDNTNADTANKYTFNGKLLAETEAIYKRIYNDSEELLLKKHQFEALKEQYDSIKNKNSAEAVKIRQEAEVLQIQQQLRIKELNAYEKYLKIAENESEERIKNSTNERRNRTANTVNNYLDNYFGTIMQGLNLLKFW